MANSTLTLFGAENVKSNAATLVRECGGRSDPPVTGSQPAIARMNPSRSTCPERPIPPHPPADPAARSLTPAREVILEALGDLLLVVSELIR
jgi:hypothetical protein